MKNNPFSSLQPASSAGALPAALLSAALGQFFLIQRDQSWTAWVGCALYAAAVFFFLRCTGKKEAIHPPQEAIPPWIEALLFFLVLSTAVFFRFYRIDEFPAGIFPDEARLGWVSLQILHEGWRPFYEVYQLSVWDPPLYYLLAAWFKLWSPTQVSLFSFSIFFGLLSFPFIYWTFRQLAGPRIALLTLFILAVMRWHIIYSRNCHPAIQVPFYMFGTLAFWLYAFRTGKLWAFLAGSVFFAGGLYIYQAYKAFLLLLLIYLIYEIATNQKTRTYAGKIIIFFFSFSILSSPIWIYLLKNKSVTSRPELLAFPKILESGTLKPLLDHFFDAVFMFHRHGDPWCLHNLPHHRMLDDVTGILFIFGFFYALSMGLKRKYFYSITGVAVMCLPAFLSIDANHASRMFGVIPFVAFLAALALETIGEKTRALKLSRHRATIPVILAFFLTAIAAENFIVYFHKEARDESCWRGAFFTTEACAAGRTIAHYGSGYEYYLSSHFYGRYDVMFLSYSQKDHVHLLSHPGNLASLSAPRDRGFCFILEEGRTGFLQMLQDLYPGGETEYFKDLQGHSIVYFYRVTPDEVHQGMTAAKKKSLSHFGLKGAYRPSLDSKTPPALIHNDPLLNFTYRDDFPFTRFPPLWVQWTGMLEVARPGPYKFLALTSDSAAMVLDGDSVLEKGNSESSVFYLNKGPHSLVVHFKKISGVDAAFSLLWKPPGAPKFEVIPYTAFRSHP